MNSEINLAERFNTKLGVRGAAIKIFENLEGDVVLDFEGVEFISRSFAQEYVFQKHKTKANIHEINKCEFVEKLLEIVQDDFERICLS